MIQLLPVLLFCADPTVPAVRDSIGVNIHFTGAPARDLDLIRDAGFGWVRMDLVWETVEREKGSYRFEPYDELLDGLESRGIRALFILDYSNPLYEKERSVRTDEGRAAFARFAEAAAARYRGRRSRWEIWNEPNHEQFWRPGPDPGEYAALAVMAAKAIRAADPAAVILAPASSGFPWEFLERVFEKGLLEHIDEVSVHPYRPIAPESVQGDYTRLRDLIAKHAPAREPPPRVVSGEWGYSNHHWGQAVPENVQAAYLARQFLTNIACGIPLSIWYDWANDGPDPKNAEHNFGVVTQDREPKAAYDAARTLVTVIGGRRLAGRLHVGDDDHLLVFEANGQVPILVAWTAAAPHSVTIKSPGLAGPVRIVDSTGGESSIEPAPEGSLELPLEGSPTYVELPGRMSDVVVHGITLVPEQGFLRIAVLRTGPGKRSGTLEVRVGAATSRHPVMLDAAGIARVEVPVEWPVEPPLPVSVTLLDAESGESLGAVPCTSYAAVRTYMEEWVQAAGNLRNFQVCIEGEADVKGACWVTRRTKPLDPAAPRPPAAVERAEAKALSCSYRLEGRGKYLRISPVERPEIRGKPCSLFLLVNGDGSGSRIRCRIKDSKGEVFQPQGLDVNWKGWKQVRLPLDGREASHWGGDENGVVDYPVSWDTLFLVEAAGSGSAGTLDFQFPLLVYPAE